MSLAENLSWRSSLPTGWAALYEELVYAIAREDRGAVVEQAKQKFGTPRVCLNRLTPATKALIDEASRRQPRPASDAPSLAGSWFIRTGTTRLYASSTSAKRKYLTSSPFWRRIASIRTER